MYSSMEHYNHLTVGWGVMTVMKLILFLFPYLLSLVADIIAEPVAFSVCLYLTVELSASA